MARIRFMNIEIDNLTMDEALLEIDRLIRTRSDAFVVTPNVDHIVQIEKGGVLGKIYQKADLILCDGKPLIWLSYWYGTQIKEKISGSDLFPAICRMAAVRGYRMYFLGAAEGVAAKAAENLTRKFPGLQVVGTYSPPYGFEKDTEEIQKIIRQIREARPQILIVGLGCPKQEKFIYDYRKDYNVPVSLGLGASLDFEAGRIQRAPRWMSDHGLEWIYRIFQDPRRLIKRYLIDDICIFRLAVKYKRKLRKKE